MCPCFEHSHLRKIEHISILRGKDFIKCPSYMGTGGLRKIFKISNDWDLLNRAQSDPKTWCNAFIWKSLAIFLKLCVCVCVCELYIIRWTLTIIWFNLV